jgi:hypothetical protein
MTRMQKTLYYLAWIGLAMAGIVLFVGLWWTVYPYKTVEFKTDTFKVINKEVKAGGLILYDVDACKYTTQKPEVDAIFVDSIKYLSAEQFAKLAEGCRITRVERHIPQSLPSGRYHLEVTVRYPVNPIRTIIKTMETDEFEVTNDSK